MPAEKKAKALLLDASYRDKGDYSVIRLFVKEKSKSYQ